MFCRFLYLPNTPNRFADRKPGYRRTEVLRLDREFVFIA